MDKPFEIIITTTHEGISLTIARRSGYNYQIQVAKPVTLEFEEIKEGDTFKPTLIFNHIDAAYFFEALKEALEPVGKKREKEIRMKAKIEAQDEHIKDLRKLVEVLGGSAKRRISIGEEDT